MIQRVFRRIAGRIIFLILLFLVVDLCYTLEKAQRRLSIPVPVSTVTPTNTAAPTIPIATPTELPTQCVVEATETSKQYTRNPVNVFFEVSGPQAWQICETYVAQAEEGITVRIVAPIVSLFEDETCRLDYAGNTVIVKTEFPELAKIFCKPLEAK